MKHSILKKHKKIFVSLLVALVFVANCVFLTSCGEGGETKFDNTYKPPIYNTSGEEQKAIIILPGILGSNLVNTKTNEPLWSGGALLNNLLMVKGRLEMDNITTFFENFLLKNEKGETPVPVRAANMNDQYLEYGIIDEYRSLYNFFNNNYGEGNKELVKNGKAYKVVVYQYDWTKSCKDSATDLQAFIDANKFSNNVLVGHSMGGLVIDYYLASSKDNVNKTDKFISLGTPHEGALDPLMLACCDLDIDINLDTNTITKLPSFVEKLTGMSLNDIKGMTGSFEGIGFKDKIPKEYLDKNGEPMLLDFAQDLLGEIIGMARTMPSLYDLLPTEKLMDSITVNNNTISYDDLVTKMLNTPTIKSSTQLTTNINNAIENRKLLTVNGTFASDLLGNNTYYIYGTGKIDSKTNKSITLTTDSINFNTKPNDSKLYLTIDIDLTNLKRKGGIGDSMVLFKSATLSKDSSSNNVFELKGFDHIDLYTPTSPKEGSHFLPILVNNELGEILAKEIM